MEFELSFDDVPFEDILGYVNGCVQDYAEREVYSYIRCLARLENSEEAIDAFYSLLFKGVVTHRQFESSSVRTALVSV
ncbi:MAG: hypothetical protein AAGI45_20535, partial [Cyanobacteria bacterium P01_H01_bin.26]